MGCLRPGSPTQTLGDDGRSGIVFLLTKYFILKLSPERRGILDPNNETLIIKEENMPFNYTTIVPLYDNSGAVKSANKGTFSEFTRAMILELREDVDYLGELIGITGANWTGGRFNWTKGTTVALATGREIWKSYITDLRTACEELYTARSLGAPVWTVATADFKGIWDSSGIPISANLATYTPRRMSLITDIRTALIAVADSTFIFIDAVSGNDTTGTGAKTNPYKTWDKGVAVINSAGGGSMYFMPGTYDCTTQMTQNNVTVRGDVLGDVTFRALGASNGAAIFYTASGLSVENIIFKVTSASYYFYFNTCAALTVNSCIFTQDSAVGNVAFACYAPGSGSALFNHCTFMGYNKFGRAIMLTAAPVTFNDCIFYDYDDCVYFGIGYSGNVTENSCGFFEYNNQHDKYATSSYTLTQSGVLTSDPKISDKSTGYLASTSPYIDQATDGYDIGAYKDGPYNVTESAADSLTIAESAGMALTLFADDSIKAQEDLTSETISLATSMFLGGLFRSSNTGVVTYLDSLSVSCDNPAFSYDGAAVDMSFTPTGGSAGNRRELYIRAVASSDTTDYDAIAWWEANAYQNGDITRLYAGATTGTYFIDSWKECISGLEFGEDYEFSAVTADGVNDQQADITIKCRVKDVVTGVWSEVVTLTKTYYFNDFDKTLYYCADNPRVIDDEYANDPNYYAQTYHTGTTKYTRPDGVEWSADGRRFAYNPIFKADWYMAYNNNIPVSGTTYGNWQDRNSSSIQPLGENNARTIMMVHAMTAVNFGNWNTSGEHIFTNPSTAQPQESGTVTVTAAPVFGDNASDLHYLIMTPVKLSDCGNHSSHQSLVVRFPSGENVVWGDYPGKHVGISDSDFYFLTAVDPWGCTTAFHYLWVKDNSASPVTGGYVPYISTRQLYQVNTNSTGGLSYGQVFRQYVTNGSSIGAPAW